MSYALTARPAAAHHQSNHQAAAHIEAEYDRLRGRARAAAQKRSDTVSRSRAAYQRGDGALAHSLSEEAKRHAADADAYNRQARDYIFAANNRELPEDSIDLHGLYVEEVEEALTEKLRLAQRRGVNPIWVIVGKGNHSQGNVRKVAPKVEEVCRRMGLRCGVDERNAGRMWVEIGGPPLLPGQGVVEDVVEGFWKQCAKCCVVM